MSDKEKKVLSDAMREADLVDLEEDRLEEVAGGVCDESCFEGCSACCSIGSANRGKPSV